MKQYVWQKAIWPNLTWDTDALISLLGRARLEQGRLISQANSIGLQAEAEIVVEEVFTTSAIEGEKLDKESIRSSVARKLGLSTVGLAPSQRYIDALVDMLLDATLQYDKKLTEERLCGWQAAIFPTGHSGFHKILVGKWRKNKEPMQVISGPIGKEKIHFEAPPAEVVVKEMQKFLSWWNKPEKNIDGLLRAGQAHFWFLTVHPFEDGNGRIARAITEMALAQDEKMGKLLYSMSGQILKTRESYYTILEKNQKSNGDITFWLEWFLETLIKAIEASKKIVNHSMEIALFWKKHNQTDLNERQRKVILKIFETEGLKNSITNRKYVSLTKTSRETAKRDLVDLEQKGILRRNSGSGRSVSYSLVINPAESKMT